jgi:uncharacterized membrane protein
MTVTPLHHPVVNRLDAERAKDLQLRLADHITAFVGSMPFVYIHVLLFGVWMLVFEKSPWPTLTLAVSLEAIFLSCFVMIGQNHQAAFQQAKADHEYLQGEQELKLNTELTRAIHELTSEVHERIVGDASPVSELRSPSSPHHPTATSPRSPARSTPAANAGPSA